LFHKNVIFGIPSWIVIVSVIFIISGIVFVLWQQTEISNGLGKRDWSVVKGEIVESEIVGERAIRAEVKYKYIVKDSIYFGTSDYHIPGFGSKNYRRKNARIVKNENPVGSKINIYYNPSKPEISTLRYGPYWSNYMIIGFGGFLLLIGMFVIEHVLLKKIFKQ
jgi:hypothetical protein